MKDSLLQLGNQLLNRVDDDCLLALSEGFIKVRCAEIALALGWTLQEGVGNKGVADFASLVDNRLVWQRNKRILSLASGSADLTIVSPVQMLLEIKARPDHGTKSQAQFQEMDADVARAASNPLCALLFVFETKAYRSFSLEKEDNRGRYALAADWFNQYFPKLSMIPSSEWLAIEAPRGSSRLNLWFRQSTPQKFDKVIFVLGCQVQTVR